MNLVNNCLALLISATIFSACIPGHLSKYRKDSGSLASGASQGSSLNAQATSQQKSRQRPSIFSVDNQTFRFMLRDDKVWKAALAVLIKNYNLNIVDKTSGIITTEWDSFYLKGAVYRNKVSILINRVSWNNVDVTIMNNVESLIDSSGNTVGSVWLPAEDKAGELGRIIQNMAVVLHQPVPTIPGNVAVAKDGLNSIPSEKSPTVR